MRRAVLANQILLVTHLVFCLLLLGTWQRNNSGPDAPSPADVGFAAAQTLAVCLLVVVLSAVATVLLSRRPRTGVVLSGCAWLAVLAEAQVLRGHGVGAAWTAPVAVVAIGGMALCVLTLVASGAHRAHLV
jgi:hypothetical protein